MFQKKHDTSSMLKTKQQADVKYIHNEYKNDIISLNKKRIKKVKKTKHY